MVHGLSCSTARGIFQDQGSNPCLVHWLAILNHCATREVLTYFSRNITLKDICIKQDKKYNTRKKIPPYNRHTCHHVLKNTLFDMKFLEKEVCHLKGIPEFLCNILKLLISFKFRLFKSPRKSSKNKLISTFYLMSITTYTNMEEP